MLNLVTGVFVDGAQRIVREDRDKELLRLAAKLFAAADQDGSADISADEFEQIRDSDLMSNFCQVNNIAIDEIDMLFHLLCPGSAGEFEDEDGGSVSVTQFVRGCKMLQGEARAADIQTVKLMCKQHFESQQQQISAFSHKLTNMMMIQKTGRRGGELASGSSLGE